MSSIISPEITVKELLDRYPRLLPMFIDMGLMCVGCPAEAFHTLADVSRENHLDLKLLLQCIQKMIGKEE